MATARLKDKYVKEIMPALKEKFQYKSVMQVPKITKISINRGIGNAVSDKKLVDTGVDELTTLSGQKAVATKAKNSISNFKLREGMPIGARVTLRGEKMYEFMDRLLTIALPRVRDFKGVSDKGFDGRGNYTLGIKEQIIFPEISIDKIKAISGMDITFVTTAQNDEESYELLKAFGMPFTNVKNNIMAKESVKARELKRQKLVTKYAEKRKELKAAGDWEGLDKLPKNASPVRLHNRCKLTGRPRGYMRKFGISRVTFRELASAGKIPGVTKSSW
jgi:large subunit ribosomal protein L5